MTETLKIKQAEKLNRLQKVNKLIREIADCGRRFFYSKSNNRYAQMEIDKNGKIWFIDDYTGKRIYTHCIKWKGFSHGGTLKGLIELFRDYIGHNKQINPANFGPWPDWCCGGDLWGYGDDMEKVRNAAIIALGLIEQ